MKKIYLIFGSCLNWFYFFPSSLVKVLYRPLHSDHELIPIYVSDFEDWLVHSKASTYADDSATGVKGNSISEVVSMLEEDGKNVLMYMASNGLVANPSKTALLFLNNKEKGEPVKITIGPATVTQEKSAKLLGLTLDDSQSWHTHFYGKGGVLSALNQRLFILRRMKNHLMSNGLRKVAESLFNSKLRYGLQMCGKIRWNESDTTPKLLKDLQMSQNKMLRLLNNSRISDRISTSSLLKKFNMMSVNQINAQMKLSEMWKAVRDDDHPFNLEKKLSGPEVRSMRSISNGTLPVSGFSELSKNTFINDGIKAWNLAPTSIKDCNTFASAKTAIKKFVKSIPI